MKKPKNPENGGCHYKLFLVSRYSVRNARVVVVITQILQEEFGSDKLEIVDLIDNPERAVADNVLVTPTLMKSMPLPMRKVVGELDDRNRARRAIELISKECN